MRAAPQGLRLHIHDDGIGVPQPPDQGDGMGLPIMRYRAEQIGGALHVGPAEGGGTVVTCVVARRNGDDADGGEDPDRG